MGFADEVLAHTKSQGPSCTVCDWLEQLPPKERDEYAHVLADRSFQGTSIQRALKARGYTFGVDTVRRHRNGECKARKK